MFRKKDLFLAVLLLLPVFLSTSCRLFFPIAYDVTSGDPYAASGNFYDAMRAGNGKKAVYWARRVIYNENKPYYGNWTDQILRRNPIKPYYHFGGEFKLIAAYEMNGELEKALTLFQDLVQRGRATEENFLHARLLFKLGRKAESYDMYCHLLQEYADDPKYDEWFTECYSLLFGLFPFSFLENDDCELRSRYCSFADIHVFYLFMNEEYEKQNRPEKYAKVMAFLQKVDQRREEIMKRYEHQIRL
jgi:tetratricopeptide (TPR) repeat protein